MVLKFLKHRWQRVTAWVLLTLTALVLILSFFLNLYWSPILASKVKDVVLKSSDSLYTVSFSSAELHVLRGTIVIFNITLKPDTAIYNRRNKQHLAPNNLVELHVKRLTLSHIHPFKLYFQHKLEIGGIAVNDPVINVSYQLNHTRDTVLKQSKTAWQKISKSLHSIHIGTILLGDVKLVYKDYSGNKLTVSELKEMNLSANDLLIDSATQTDTSRLLYCKEIIAELNNYTATSPNGLYYYKFKHLKLSTRTAQLNIEGLSLKPANTEEFFHKSNRDRFTLRLDSIQLNHFDFLNYHKYRIINISSLILKQGSVEILGNPNNFQDGTDKIKSYPGVGLSKINAEMKIDTALIRHVNVFYSEYNKKSDKTGTISFNNTTARFLNITTNPAALQKNNISTVQLTSYFMDRGKLDLEVAFNLTAKNHAFAYKGKLGAMDLKPVNAATMPLAMVKITSGTLKELSFDIKADGTKSGGKVVVLYNSLKVVILKADTVFDKLKRKPIESLFANLFILKHNNPDVTGGVPRSFYVNHTRTTTTPFFKFMWQTLLSGIKPAIGLDKKTEGTIVTLKSNREIKKQNRKVKKELRIKRREARREKRAERKLLKSGP